MAFLSNTIVESITVLPSPLIEIVILFVSFLRKGGKDCVISSPLKSHLSATGVARALDIDAWHCKTKFEVDDHGLHMISVGGSLMKIYEHTPPAKQ